MPRAPPVRPKRFARTRTINCPGHPAPLRREEEELAFAESLVDGGDAFLEVGFFFEDGEAFFAIEEGAEEFGLTGEGLVTGDHGLKRRGFLAVALAHAVVFGDGLVVDEGDEGADRFGKALEGLGAGDVGGFMLRFGTRGRREEFAAVIALGGFDRFAGATEEFADFGADELIVGAELVFAAVEVVAPAVEEVDGYFFESVEVVEAGHGV